MNNALIDLARHHTWATSQLLTFCQNLEQSRLNATAPGTFGTFGTIIETLRHLIDAEASYLYRLTGAWPDHPWRGDADVALDVLGERAAILGGTLEHFIATEWDSERLGHGRGDGGSVFVIRTSIFLTQLLHHANEHRAHVCTIIGALGLEPPDVSAWGYALESGRSTKTHSGQSE